jgi:hypothetical protein
VKEGLKELINYQRQRDFVQFSNYNVLRNMRYDQLTQSSLLSVFTITQKQWLAGGWSGIGRVPKLQKGKFFLRFVTFLCRHLTM